MPTLPYTGAYAFANVLLTVAGSGILLLRGAGMVYIVLLVMLIAEGARGSVRFKYHGDAANNA
ncbi:MAG: hypothetical protein C5S48_04400 [Candidatus Methanogaster sp.]|nr:MAG: hypothetical protein C5S48_04400 [ANME-2 cluster archaeon]